MGDESRMAHLTDQEIAAKATATSHEARKIKVKDLKKAHAKKHAKITTKNKKKIQWMY